VGQSQFTLKLNMFYNGFISLRVPEDSVNLLHIPCVINHTKTKLDIIVRRPNRVIKIFGRRYKQLYVLKSEYLGMCILRTETLHQRYIPSLAGYWVKGDESLFWRLIFNDVGAKGTKHAKT